MYCVFHFRPKKLFTLTAWPHRYMTVSQKGAVRNSTSPGGLVWQRIGASQAILLARHRFVLQQYKVQPVPGLGRHVPLIAIFRASSYDTLKISPKDASPSRTLAIVRPYILNIPDCLVLTPNMTSCRSSECLFAFTNYISMLVRVSLLCIYVQYMSDMTSLPY